MFIILLLAAILVVGGFIYLQQLKPQYSGELVLEGLHQKVEVYFDPYAVPHIYARNEADAYFATRAHDAYGDFAAVGYEDLLKHGIRRSTG